MTAAWDEPDWEALAELDAEIAERQHRAATAELILGHVPVDVIARDAQPPRPAA